MTQRLAHLAILAIVGGLWLLGAFQPLALALVDLRYRLLPREASGELIVVQIDARSLRELRTWPWPREYYASVIDQLFKAGVREVAVDIDFSASSRLESDLAMAQSLQRANGQVILPAFRQLAAPHSASREVLDSLPLPLFRAQAQVGAVNVFPGSDGLIRELSTTQIVDGDELPSMFVLLAGPAYLERGEFLLDLGIDPASIPRLSFSDVLGGAVPAQQLAGRRILIGATALELGDNLTVPIHRTVTGPVLQALAYESLIQNRALQPTSGFVTLFGVALLVLIFAPRFESWTWRRGAAVGSAALLGLEGAALGVQAILPVVVDTAPWLVAVGFCYLYSQLRSLELQGRQILQQRITIVRRRALMDRVVNHSFDGIVITDSDGTVEVFNDAAGRILGLDAGAVSGRRLADVLPVVANLGYRVAEVTDEHGTSHLGPLELEVARADGQSIMMELIVSHSSTEGAWSEGEWSYEPRIFIYTFRDITERSRVREAERRAAEEAQAANRAKSEFLANMGHELRTPLNAIIGFSEIITSQAFGPLEPPRYREYIESINTSGHRLLEVINDVLDASRIELGQIALDETELDLKEIGESCRRFASGWQATQSRDFQIEIAPGASGLTADRRLVKQTIVNLLSNAVKFSRSGDCVRLRIYRSSAGEPTIEVEDGGIGIAAEDIPRLTTPFYQVDGSLARREEGTGLGLSLVAAYTRLHGGSLSIESELGLGTTVTVRYPASRALAPADDEGSRAIATRK